MLSLQGAGMIPEDEWKETMALQPRALMGNGEPYPMRNFEAMVELVLKYNITRLSTITVEKILRAVSFHGFYFSYYPAYTNSISTTAAALSSGLHHPKTKPPGTETTTSQSANVSSRSTA